MPALMSAARETTLKAADGASLFIADNLLGQAQGERRGIVLMHGLGEHCGRYEHVAQFFNQAGWSVRRYDLRGHGRSDGERGDVPDDHAMLDDARLVIGDFTAQLGAPPLLLGHSMGGLFAARYATAALSPLRGLILSSPALALTLSGPQKLLLKSLTAVAPGFTIPNGLETAYLCHDPAVVAAYENDKLVHEKINARLLNCMLEAIEFAQAHASRLAIPTLMVVAGDDHAVNAEGSQNFFPKLAPGIGTMHLYADLYHEVFNEPDVQRVYDDVSAWLATV